MPFNRTKSCTAAAWKILLSDSLDDASIEQATRHVEGCEDCRSQLQQASDKPSDWWDEARRSWLEEELPISSIDESTWISIEVGSELPHDTTVEAERVSLAFLGKPTHPELLGRIGRYNVERVIGTGGMGVVLKAFDTELNRVVAIKVLSDHLANNASARRRFAREAQAAAAVIHPNVIPIYNVETDDRFPYLVMQCVHGSSLQSKVDRHGPMSVEEVLRIAKQTAAGLSAAHEQGLVHRDVKPANILMEENVDRVLLSDFGLARAVDDASMTRTGVVAGTPHYMSPEQARGESIQCASDQFSLGCVVYFMLTGRPPFRAETAMGILNRICHEPHRPVHEVRSDVPREICDLVDRLLEKDPRDRFASTRFVEQEVDRLLVLLQSGNLSLALPGRYGWGSWHSVVAGLAAVCLVILAGTQIWSGRGMEGDGASNDSPSRTSGQLDGTDITVRELLRLRSEWQAALREEQAIDIQVQQFANNLKLLEQEWNATGGAPVSQENALLLEIEQEVWNQRLETENWK